MNNNLGNCLVIGGAGMLGYEIVQQLLKEGYSVRVLDLDPVKIENAEVFMGDITDAETVDKVCKDVNTVFQTAAAIWNPKLTKEIYDKVNIHGNRNVLESCLKHSVSRLVYTSTLDVVVDGKKPIVYGDESLPYPNKTPKDHYSRTKIIAEKEVIAANGVNGLLTCSLRPVGMYGPRDKYHIANIIEVAKSNNNIKLGNGTACFSHVYSENAAYAHVLAAKHLHPESTVPGECYFIADHQPANNLFEFMKPYLKELGLPIPTKSIPYRLAYFLAFFAEIFAPKSNFNRFAVVQTCVDHTFVSDKAERDFGYKPIVSKEEAFQKTVEWFKAQDIVN
ncbi:NAD-dependent epimerase/dehydratase family protein [Candidatus Heimdallarchaeota archaeon]|nr:MAG: NAD-dependent epimerase/dehydratase family protein [Candidatus Heimdallarchaeota archaeon]